MELTVVIALIAILTALIIPEMRGTYEDALLRATGRELVNTFELASSRAISLNQPHRVQLDLKTGHYQVARKTRVAGQESFVPLTDVSGSGGALDPRITLEMQAPDEAVPADAEMAVPTEPGHFMFYPDGTADAAAIQLRDRAGFRLQLVLNPVTSRIHLTEPIRE